MPPIRRRCTEGKHDAIQRLDKARQYFDAPWSSSFSDCWQTAEGMTHPLETKDAKLTVQAARKDIHAQPAIYALCTMASVRVTGITQYGSSFSSHNAKPKTKPVNRFEARAKDQLPQNQRGRKAVPTDAIITK